MKKLFKTSVIKSFPFGKGFRIGLLLILFSVTLCKAQWVTIPDANFVAWLETNYPSCMNGNQMNTSCSAIVNDVHDSTVTTRRGMFGVFACRP